MRSAAEMVCLFRPAKALVLFHESLAESALHPSELRQNAVSANSCIVVAVKRRVMTVITASIDFEPSLGVIFTSAEPTLIEVHSP